MKSVLLSIQPKWCELIASRKKTVEVRKSAPKLETPFVCYIYCTKAKNKNEDLWSDARAEPILENGEERLEYVAESLHYMNGKVIGEFVCDAIWMRPRNTIFLENAQKDYEKLLELACLTEKEVLEYLGGGYTKYLHFWHISDLKIYDKPKELEAFYMSCKWYEKGEGCGDENCPLYESPDPYYGEVWNDCEGKKPISRPPQSWCYVEELCVKYRRKYLIKDSLRDEMKKAQ